MKRSLFVGVVLLVAVGGFALWRWDHRRVLSDEALCIERYVLPARSANAAGNMARLCDRLAQSPLPEKWYARYQCYQRYIPAQRNLPAERAAERMCDLWNPI